MRIAVSSDERNHLVDFVLTELQERGFEAEYFGPPTASKESADWPEVTARAVQSLVDKTADEAIVMCWTGTGATLVANKFPGIRAALCQDAETARGARIWNHANVLGLSLRTTSEAIAKEILDMWFSTPFSEDDWNRQQIQRISELESKLDEADQSVL